MSGFTSWADTGFAPQTIAPGAWTALLFTDPGNPGVVALDRMPMLNGTTTLDLHVHLTLPKAPKPGIPSARPTEVRLRFRRYLPDGSSVPFDPTAYRAIAVPPTGTTWYDVLSVTKATFDDTPIGADLKHDAPDPLVSPIRIMTAANFEELARSAVREALR